MVFEYFIALMSWACGIGLFQIPCNSTLVHFSVHHHVDNICARGALCDMTVSLCTCSYCFGFRENILKLFMAKRCEFLVYKHALISGNLSGLHSECVLVDISCP